MLRDDFRPDSDVDVLVEFEPGTHIGWEIGGMQQELSKLFGREVHLSTRGSSHDDILPKVLATAQTLYEAA